MRVLVGRVTLFVGLIQIMIIISLKYLKADFLKMRKPEQQQGGVHLVRRNHT